MDLRWFIKFSRCSLLNGITVEKHYMHQKLDHYYGRNSIHYLWCRPTKLFNVFVYFQKERDKKEMLFFILTLCYQLINKDGRAYVIMMTSYFISERVNWTGHRLGRSIGNMKLYSDNISSACSISLFLSAFLLINWQHKTKINNIYFFLFLPEKKQNKSVASSSHA